VDTRRYKLNKNLKEKNMSWIENEREDMMMAT
jgi:hypothetical protein